MADLVTKRVLKAFPVNCEFQTVGHPTAHER